MSTHPEAGSIEDAKRQATVARARIDESLGALQGRLSPRIVAQDAWHTVRETSDRVTDQAIDGARKQPGLAGAAGAAIVLIAFRKPVFRLVGKLFKRRPEDGPRESRRERKARQRLEKAPAPVSTPPDDLIPHASTAPAATTIPEGVSHGH